MADPNQSWETVQLPDGTEVEVPVGTSDVDMLTFLAGDQQDPDLAAKALGWLQQLQAESQPTRPLDAPTGAGFLPDAAAPPQSTAPQAAPQAPQGPAAAPAQAPPVDWATRTTAVGVPPQAIPPQAPQGGAPTTTAPIAPDIPQPNLDPAAGLSRPEQLLAGVGENILSGATGLAGSAAAGLTGAPVAATQGLDAGVEQIDAVQQAMTYQPRTAAGKQIQQILADTIGLVVEKGTEALGDLGESLGQRSGGVEGGKVGGTLGEMIPTVIELLLARGALRRGDNGQAQLTPEVDAKLRGVVEAETPEQAAVLAEQAAFDTGPQAPTKAERTPVPGEPPPVPDVKADLAAGVPSNETATQRIVNPDAPYDKQKTAPDPVGKRAVKQGLPEGTVASIKAANGATRDAMRKSLDELEKGLANDSYEGRPADVAGDVVLKDIQFLQAIKLEAQRKLNQVAKDLKGVPVDYSPSVQMFLDELGEMGVIYDGSGGRPKLIYPPGSQLANLPKVQKLINATFKELERWKKNPDAWDVHVVKKWIDENVSYGKTSGKGYSANVDRIIKQLRHNLNKNIQAVSPEYKAVNTQYADARTALDNMQAVAGKKMDLSGQRAGSAIGTLLRRILSNAQSRIPVREAVEDVSATAKKYGGVSEVDTHALLKFINTLEENFGSSAPNSFMHEIVKAGQAAAAAKAGSPGAMVDLARQGRALFSRQTDEKKLAALRELLKDEPTPPLALPAP